MSLSPSWTTCKVEAYIWASPGCVRTVARGTRRWRVEASAIYFVIKLLPLLYKMWVNKAVVCSGHGDASKYMGEGVASCGTPSTLGGPYHINYIKLWLFWGIFQETRFGHATYEACHLVCHITSFNDAVTSYMMSQHHMCIGHMIIYYKRAANTSVKAVRFDSVTRDPSVSGV